MGHLRMEGIIEQSLFILWVETKVVLVAVAVVVLAVVVEDQ